MPVEILGAQEAAQLFNLTAQGFRARRQQPDFPEPFAELACGPVWTRDQLLEYARARADHFHERESIIELAHEPVRYDRLRGAETR